jgi:hypothetical protein
MIILITVFLKARVNNELFYQSHKTKSVLAEKSGSSKMKKKVAKITEQTDVLILSR